LNIVAPNQNSLFVCRVAQNMENQMIPGLYEFFLFFRVYSRMHELGES